MHVARMYDQQNIIKMSNLVPKGSGYETINAQALITQEEKIILYEGVA